MTHSPATKSCEHVVQFHGNEDERLVSNVAAYLGGVLRMGGAALVVAEPSRRELLRREIERTANDAAGWGDRAIWLDSAETLARFMRDGMPSAQLFSVSIGAIAKDLLERFGALGAYGEMVGCLWSERNYSAAIELERLWNALLGEAGFGLFCGYPVDVLSDDFQIATIRDVLAAHTRVVAARRGSFDDALRRAMYEALGEREHGMHSLASGRPRHLATELPNVEGTILRLRSALPRHADAILSKAKAYARE